VLLVQLAIVVAAVVGGVRLFTNGIEWAGALARLSEAKAGSLLAAWGTALPETLVPLIALGRGGGARMAIGVGAVLGAPLFLATLAMALLGLEVLRRAGSSAGVVVSPSGLRRDLGWFIAAFALAVAASALGPVGRVLTAAALLAGYACYVRRTWGESGGAMLQPMAPLLLAARASRPPTWAVLAQTTVGFGAILLGAELFVSLADRGAGSLGMDRFLLAALVTPLATELPEVLNSLVWLARGRDVLAVSNLTGAMAFQGSVVPALAMLLSPWHLGGMEGAVALTAWTAAVWLRLAGRGGRLRPVMLLGVGALYPVLCLGLWGS
jgi:cation:H+ antiporter